MRIFGWINKKPKPPILESGCKTGIQCIHQSPQPSFDHKKNLFEFPFEVESSFSDYYNGFSQENTNPIVFNGFLTIGTLGLDQEIDAPPTPTFPFASPKFVQEKKEATEKNMELEVEDELDRNSIESPISFSSISQEGIKDGEKYKQEESQLRLNIEVPDSKKATFADLIRRAKFSTTRRKNEGDNATEKQIPTLNCFKGLRNASPKCSSKHELIKSVPIKKKLSKMLKLLCPKVHPENVAVYQENEKCRPTVREDPNQTDFGLDSTKPPDRSLTLPQYGLNCISRESGEHWIRTDANYLVLEL